jgi:hypothetical protein
MLRVTLLTAGAAAFLLLAPLTTHATTLPSATPTVSGITGTNGWYRGSADGDYVVVHWTVTDPDHVVVDSSGCGAAVQVPGPTAPSGTTLTCTLYIDLPGNPHYPLPYPTTVKIDNTPPTDIAATVSRGPDYNGWYNHPVGIAWGGSDASSGIASCSSTTYAGPDGSGVAVPGSCTDVAGNTSAAATPINYDSTPPALTNLSVTSTATADVVRWTSSSPTDSIVVRRLARGNKKHVTVFHGSGRSRVVDRGIKPGVQYQYSIQAVDQAGNASPEAAVGAPPKVLVLGATSYVPTAASRPILRWKRVKGAGYYHVQLFHGSRRILAAWPQKHELGLPAAWRWAGHRHRLGPGRYRWYVWAGLGARAAARYRAIGSAQFIVPR